MNDPTRHKIMVNCPDCWARKRTIRGTWAVIEEDEDCETTWHVALGPCDECGSASTATYYDTGLTVIISQVRLAWTRGTK
jgi:hypothetical protein